MTTTDSFTTMSRIGILSLLVVLAACKADKEPLSVSLPARQDTWSPGRIDAMSKKALAAFLDSVRQTQQITPEPLADLYERACGGVYVVLTMDEEGEWSGLGTAFLIEQAGILVTNEHVMESAVAAVVLDRDKNMFEVESVLHLDPDWDNAVIRIKPPFHGGVVLPIAADYPRIGDETFAIGTPLGFDQTITTGIISGFRDSMVNNAPIRSRGNVLQTTTAIAEGSSGGPLFNRRGEVIGITTAGYETGSLNFAISVKAIPLDRILGATISERPSGLPTTPSGTKVRQALDNYFAALIGGDQRDILPCYATTVNRYYADYSLSAGEAAEADAKSRWNKSWIPVRYTPDWDRASLSALTDGVALTIPVICQGLKDGDVEERELDYRFEFDAGYLIRLITEESQGIR